jgi:hypothetical protein
MQDFENTIPPVFPRGRARARDGQLPSVRGMRQTLGMSQRPERTEAAAYYSKHIDRVPDGEIPFAFPVDVKGLDGARALVRSLSEKSIKAFEAGRLEEAARDLLGCVLAVTTPMEAGP